MLDVSDEQVPLLVIPAGLRCGRCRSQLSTDLSSVISVTKGRGIVVRCSAPECRAPVGLPDSVAQRPVIESDAGSSGKDASMTNVRIKTKAAAKRTPKHVAETVQSALQIWSFLNNNAPVLGKLFASSAVGQTQRFLAVSSSYTGRVSSFMALQLVLEGGLGGSASFSPSPFGVLEVLRGTDLFIVQHAILRLAHYVCWYPLFRLVIEIQMAAFIAGQLCGLCTNSAMAYTVRRHAVVAQTAEFFEKDSRKGHHSIFMTGARVLADLVYTPLRYVDVITKLRYGPEAHILALGTLTNRFNRSASGGSFLSTTLSMGTAALSLSVIIAVSRELGPIVDHALEPFYGYVEIVCIPAADRRSWGRRKRETCSVAFRSFVCHSINLAISAMFFPLQTAATHALITGERPWNVIRRVVAEERVRDLWAGFKLQASIHAAVAAVAIGSLMFAVWRVDATVQQRRTKGRR